MQIEFNGNNNRPVDITFVHPAMNFVPQLFQASPRLLEAIGTRSERMHGAIQGFAVRNRWFLYLMCHRLFQARDYE